MGSAVFTGGMTGAAAAAGGALKSPVQPAQRPVASGNVLDTSASPATGNLGQQEMSAFQYSIQRVLRSEISTVARIEGQVAYFRSLWSSFTKYSLTDLWPKSGPRVWIKGTPVHAPARALQNDQKVSKSLEALKALHEEKIQPKLQGIKERYRGRTFIKDSETPRELLLVSRPTEKKDLDLSFGKLNSDVEQRVYSSANSHAQLLDKGSARIYLTRSVAGLEQTFELAYKQDGKVTVFLNGEKVGSMWADDALAAASRFIAGGNLSFKRKKVSEYTVC